MRPSEINPDIELQAFLKGKAFVQDGKGVKTPVAIYTDGERSGTDVPDDFIDVLHTGSIWAVDIPKNFIRGYLQVTLYVKLNPDNTIKKSRVQKILSQFEENLSSLTTEHFHYGYVSDDFITPTTAYTAIGYSETILYLEWHTISE